MSAIHEQRISAGIEAAEPILLLRDELAGAAEAWLVGGVLRDAALGRPLADIDLAMSGPLRAVASGVARRAGGDCFRMSEEFETWRVIAPGWQLDISNLRAPEIAEDLAARDLTVNAVAMPLAGGELIDPFGGLSDIAAGTLRAVSGESFSSDPLRLLRLARFRAQLGFAADAETLALARASAHRAAESAGERQFAELRQLLCSADPLAGLELAQAIGVTAVVLPELDALRGIEQSGNHHLDTYDHTIEVLRRWLEIERDVGHYAPGLGPELDQAISQPLADELSRREAIRFSAILHDIGKPATRTERDGWVSFKGHDRVGADMIIELCVRLRTSKRFASHQAALCRHHLVLGFMVRERPLPPRRTWDYLATCGPEAVDVTLLTIADRLSAQGGGVPPEAIEGHLALAAEMLEAALAVERDGPPEPLLRGGEIAREVGIEPGPKLGEAVAELAESQYAGDVTTRDQAIAHLEIWAGGGEAPEMQ